MYPSEKPRPIDFYKEEDEGGGRDMMIEVASNGALLSQQQQQQMILGDSSGGEDSHEVKAPKKRAETWVQDETRTLIGLRRDMDGLFNTSKSNKHLWDQISSKMRDKGFDRSPTMCTDKWRNLLKEFKKTKQQDRGGTAKMSYYKDIEEIVRERNKNSSNYKSSTTSKVDSFMQFSDKGIDDTSITFGPIEGEQSNSYEERVISVKWGDYTKRIGIDGKAEAIKEAIKSAFRLRTRRAFWLEDEDNVVRTLDRDMPLGSYTLHLDEGLTIKVCLYDEPDHMGVHTEDKTLYSEEDFREFLSRRGWRCLREYSGYRTIDNMDELCPSAVYRGVN